MGGGERENQPVRSQSARPKTGEAKKTWNAKPKCYWVWPRDALAPFPPDPGCDHRDAPLCRPPGLCHLLTHLTHFFPHEVGVKEGNGGAERRVCWSLCWACHQLSEGREHRQDVLVIIMAPAEMSAAQSLCCFYSPSLHGNLIVFKMLLTWDLDGMFEVFEEMRRGRRERTSAEAAQ